MKHETGEVEFKVSHMDFVGQKTGDITKYYDLCDPPLGKGAFGEVRKGIHKISGIERAVKIIRKNTTSEEEQKRLINEVEMLRRIVLFIRRTLYYYINIKIFKIDIIRIIPTSSKYLNFFKTRSVFT